MSDQLQKYTAEVQLTGTLNFTASDDSAAAAWMTTHENKTIGIALVTLSGAVCQVRNVKVEFAPNVGREDSE